MSGEEWMSTMVGRLRAAVFLMLSVVLVQPVWAQDARGSVRGQVADGQGAPLPGVTISATSPNVGGTFSAVSDRKATTG